MMTDAILKNEERAMFALRDLYRRYGYVPYKMSRFEEYDLYVRNKDFLVSEQIITFSGDRGKLMALKPDVTLSIVKNAPEEPGVVQKVYYNENVYRDYREILQAGLECVGDLSAYEITEVVLLAVKSLEALGGRYVLDISHMGLIEAILNSCTLKDKAKAMECLRRKNLHELEVLCSGDKRGWEKLSSLLRCHGRGEQLAVIEKILTTEEERKALRELAELWNILDSAGYGSNVRLDFSVGTSMGYYSGVVFKGYLEGIPESILSGGQYDKLPRKMGRKARAIGFAIYLDLLQDLYSQEQDRWADTLILHDGTVETAALTAEAEEAARNGTILVSRVYPKDQNFKKVIRFEKGARVE
ncbi:MAG: ATP phosphoribosyltransferase regulatory subunit [Oscillospiraceae bacterium]|nr:ATP phosphoribosyltransferase regulatory subunit [Oscillospiraceae bacterium]